MYVLCLMQEWNKMFFSYFRIKLTQHEAVSSYQSHREKKGVNWSHSWLPCSVSDDSDWIFFPSGVITHLTLSPKYAFIATKHWQWKLIDHKCGKLLLQRKKARSHLNSTLLVQYVAAVRFRIYNAKMPNCSCIWFTILNINWQGILSWQQTACVQFRER